MGLNFPMPSYGGHFTWQLLRGGIIMREGEMHNLITDAGLDGMATNSIPTLTQYIAVGTGSTAPANNQTALIAEVGRVNRRSTGDDSNTSGPAFAYWSTKRVYLFIEAEANGNLTEVGLLNQVTGGILFARQLFKDVGGVPTTVIKTSADQLRITYELRVVPPTVDVNQSGLVISGVAYGFTTRAREIDVNLMWGKNTGDNVNGMLNGPVWGFNGPGGRAFDATAALGTTQNGLSGTNAAKSSASVLAYAAGTFYRELTHKWEPTDGNLAGGIGGFHMFGGDTTECFQTVVAPVFPKDSTKRLTIVSRWAWARSP